MINIVFICGSLEMGHDGVGDYTRRLAVEIIAQGHGASIVALNDKHTPACFEGTQTLDGIDIPMLRIPVSFSDTERYKLAGDYIAAVKPEWLSLQFVPYSFHPKGIPFKFFKQLKAINQQAKWHIMLHEIWLDEADGIKQKVIVFLQRWGISSGIKMLKPRVVNVSNTHNQDRLKKTGIASGILSLFGNIKKSKSGQLPVIWNQTDPEADKILYFGGPPRSFYLKQVLDGLVNYCSTASKPIDIIVISGKSAEKDKFISLLQQRLSAYKATVIDCGFIEENILSTILSNCTVGIVRSEPYFLGKSGSAMAMLEHGLPIWLPKWTKGQSLLNFNFRPNLVYAGLEDAITAKHSEYVALAPQVAQQFVAQLINN